MARRLRSRPASQRPDLTAEQILAWADAHRRRTNEWPTREAGGIADAPGKTWGAVDQALSAGLRGLPGGSSLPKVIAECRAAVGTGRS